MSFARKVHVLLKQEDSVDDAGRLKTAVDVAIFCFGYRLMSARATSIGTDGLTIDADLSRLPTHSYLEVSFRLRREVGSRLFRIPVYRHQAGADGTELLFVFPEEQQEELEDALEVHQAMELSAYSKSREPRYPPEIRRP